jgi:hypothetical protein
MTPRPWAALGAWSAASARHMPHFGGYGGPTQQRSLSPPPC